jgi:hypothetical protein
MLVCGPLHAPHSITRPDQGARTHSTLCAPAQGVRLRASSCKETHRQYGKNCSACPHHPVRVVGACRGRREWGSSFIVQRTPLQSLCASASVHACTSASLESRGGLVCSRASEAAVTSVGRGEAYSQPGIARGARHLQALVTYACMDVIAQFLHFCSSE